MFGKGSREHYSDTELATQLKSAIELTYSITFFAALKNSKIAPISLASLPKVSRKLFGNTLSAFGFRLFCLRNVHLTTHASTFLAKVWMMPYEWALKLKLLTRDTCKTKYISRRDRESAEKPLHRDVNLRERLQNCYTALFQDKEKDVHFAVWALKNIKEGRPLKEVKSMVNNLEKYQFGESVMKLLKKVYEKMKNKKNE